MKKKKIILFLVMLASVVGARADNIVSIDNIRNVVPGYTGSFDIVLNESNSATFVALGLDVQLPTGFTYTGYAKGTLLTAGHDVGTSIQPDNTTRFSAYANPTADFTATQGVLLTVYFQVAAGAVSGTATVKNASFTLGSTSYPADDASATLTVGNTVTLDENASGPPAAASGVYDVTVNRTITAGKWNTICLPFPMTAEQTKSAFGDDVELGDFNGYETDASGNISVKFTSVTAMEANHPYLVKVSSDITTFSVTDATVDISAAANPMNNKGESAAASQIKAMIGVYALTTLAANMLYLKDDTFKYSTGTAKLKPYRAYFNFCDFDPSSSANVRLDLEDATGIRFVEEIPLDREACHNLQGQRVSTPTRGLYIVNGKKVFIR